MLGATTNTGYVDLSQSLALDPNYSYIPSIADSATGNIQGQNSQDFLVSSLPLFTSPNISNVDALPSGVAQSVPNMTLAWTLLGVVLVSFMFIGGVHK